MAERMPIHDKLKEWSLKSVAVIALGATGLGLVACESKPATAEHAPISASAPATPGSSESSPAPSETTSSAPEMQETKLANSSVYNEMTSADQSLIEKDAKLSFDEFEQLPLDQRAKVALVLSDAHSSEWLKAVGELVIPGNQGQPLKDIYMPVSGVHSNAASDLYKYVLSSTPEDVTSSNNAQPYLGVQIRFSIAAQMAATGDPTLLEDAKKIVAGSLSHNDADASGEWGHLSDRISELEKMSTSKKNTLKYLGYPDAATDRHFFFNATSAPFAGYPDVAMLGFTEYDPDTHSMQEGANSDGDGAAMYVDVTYKKSNGQSASIWAMAQIGGGGAFELLPNSTS